MNGLCTEYLRVPEMQGRRKAHSFLQTGPWYKAHNLFIQPTLKYSSISFYMVNAELLTQKEILTQLDKIQRKNHVHAMFLKCWANRPINELNRWRFKAEICSLNLYCSRDKVAALNQDSSQMLETEIEKETRIRCLEPFYLHSQICHLLSNILFSCPEVVIDIGI